MSETLITKSTLERTCWLLFMNIVQTEFRGVEDALNLSLLFRRQRRLPPGLMKIPVSVIRDVCA